MTDKEDNMETESKPDTTTISMDIPMENLPIVEKKMAKLERKAKRINGCPLPTWEFGDPDFRSNNDGTFSAIVPVTITIGTIGVDNAVVLGSISHLPTEDGGETQVYHEAPGREIPEFFRGRKICDHCNKERRRSRTFVLRVTREVRITQKGGIEAIFSPGDEVQVGTTHLRDFTGGVSPDAVERWAETLQELQTLHKEEDDDGTGKQPTRRLLDLAMWLPFVAAEIRENGWISVRDSRDGGVPTYEVAKTRMAAFYDGAMVDHLAPTEEDKQMAIEAVQWARELDPDNNGFHENLKAAAAAVAVDPESESISAWIVKSYRTQQRKAEAVQQVFNLSAGHLGTPGDTVTVEATLDDVREIETRYGTKFKHLFTATGGERLVWWTGKDNSYELTTGQIKCQIKHHGEWRGTKETTITWVKPVESSRSNWEQLKNQDPITFSSASRAIELLQQVAAQAPSVASQIEEALEVLRS